MALPARLGPGYCKCAPATPRRIQSSRTLACHSLGIATRCRAIRGHPGAALLLAVAFIGGLYRARHIICLAALAAASGRALVLLRRNEF